MTTVCIQNVRVVYPGERVAPGTITIQQDRISALDAPVPAGATVIDGENRLLTPGLMDVQTHGIHRFLYERAPEDILEAAQVLPRYGTTCVLPTLYTCLNRQRLDHIDRLARAMEQVESARMPGFHFEGPFLSLTGAGATTAPGDLGLMKEMVAAAHDRVCAVSVSPEAPDILPVIEWLFEKRITVFMTHTRASVEETERAIDAGARHATHFYDVFPLPPESEPGVRPAGAVEAILADPRASVDFIADGIHVHPMAIKCALAAKTWRGVMLITDSNIGAGLPAGTYETPWGFPVRVRPDDAARIVDPQKPRDGLLAGSALTMNRGIQNLLRWLKLPPEQVWAMGSLNPARLVGLERSGCIAAGADADLVLWDEDLVPWKTIVRGQVVYERTTS